MALADNIRIAVKVCKLYYADDLSQKEISSQLGISRPQVSRILAYARANNLVTVTINNPYADEAGYEQMLTERYGLQDALVLESNPLKDETHIERFGSLAAQNLDAYITDNACVGVMSGQTISSVVHSITRFERRGLEVVPLVGGLGSTGVIWQANVIAQRLAECSGGSFHTLNAPVVVRSRELREKLSSELGIESILQKGSRCGICMIGIGEVDISSTNVRAGALTKTDIDELKKAGAVASLCTSYLDFTGQIVETSISDRSIGQTLHSIKKSKVIAFAIDPKKARAIHAALSSGFIDVFFTDLETARAIDKCDSKQEDSL